MGKLDATRAVHRRVLCFQSLRDTQFATHMLVRRYTSIAGRSARSLLHLPRLPTIHTPRLHACERLLPVTRMESCICFVVAKCKANNDLIVPSPDAVIGRPAGITTFFPVYGNMLHIPILLTYASQFLNLHQLHEPRLLKMMVRCKSSTNAFSPHNLKANAICQAPFLISPVAVK